MNAGIIDEAAPGRKADRLDPKRLLDRVGAGVGLCLAAPGMLAIAAAIRVTMGPPVLFRQARPGLGGQPFVLLKFRTMRPPHPGEGLDEAEARVTPLGRWLRKTHLDELPNLINVWRGQMSLVGPRPLLMRYLERYDLTQARRHEVCPGMTGWSQICAGPDSSWAERLALDVWYVEHQSPGLDAWILLRTAMRLLGAPFRPAAPAPPEFRGTATPARGR